MLTVLIIGMKGSRKREMRHLVVALKDEQHSSCMGLESIELY